VNIGFSEKIMQVERRVELAKRGAAIFIHTILLMRFSSAQPVDR
jgi:hypothetical protein